jgi:hypothetical protein
MRAIIWADYCLLAQISIIGFGHFIIFLDGFQFHSIIYHQLKIEKIGKWPI